MSSAATNSDVSELRNQLAQCCRVLAAAGQNDLVWGHVAVRDPLGRGAWMKAAGWGLDEITVDETLLVDWDGEVLDGRGRRHIEYPIHTEILSARPDVMAVVHTHASYPVALAAAGQAVRPVSHDATFFGIEGVALFDETDDLIRSPELGQAVASSLGDRRALILSHHGIITVGADLATSGLGAIFLDRASRTQLLATAAGTVSSSSEEETAAKQRAFSPDQVHSAWAYLIRSLNRGHPAR